MLHMSLQCINYIHSMFSLIPPPPQPTFDPFFFKFASVVLKEQVYYKHWFINFCGPDLLHLIYYVDNL
jgi:hypothetical protein